jgi:hypothetical protein
LKSHGYKSADSGKDDGKDKGKDKPKPDDGTRPSADSVLETINNNVSTGPNTVSVQLYEAGPKQRQGYDDTKAFDVSLKYSDDTPVAVSVDMNKTRDTILLSFDLSKTGKYTLAAKIGGTDIKNSPLTLDAEVRPDLNKCKAYGPGLGSGAAGEKTSFTLLLKDYKGNAVAFDGVRCQALLDLTGAAPQSLTSTPGSETGTLVFSYTRPATVTDYSIRIFVNNELLPDSPIWLNSTAQPVTFSLAQSRVIGPWPPCYAGRELEARLETYDSSGGQLRTGGMADAIKVILKQTDGNQTAAPLKLVDHLDGTYSITIPSESVAGKYNLEVTSTEGNTSATNSPLAIELLAAPVFTTFRCYGPGLSTGPAGKATQFFIRGLDQYGNAFALQKGVSFEIQSPSHMVYKATDAEVLVSYERPSGDDTPYVIRILHDGKELSESPFQVRNSASEVDIYPANVTVDWQSGDDVHSAIITGLDEHGYRWCSGGSNVVATPSDESKSLVVLGIDELDDGTYVLRYTKQSTGTLAITVNGKPIRGSPFTLPIARIQAATSGDGIEKAVLGSPSTFELRTLSLATKQPTNMGVYNKRVLLMAKEPSVLSAIPVTLVDGVQGVSTASYTVPKDMKGACPRFHAPNTCL